MDPNANLSEQIELARSIQTCSDKGHRKACNCDVDADRLAELVLSLNDWITGGGFLPLVWRQR